MYTDPVASKIAASVAEAPPQSAATLARMFRSMAEEFERIARDYENSRNHHVEIDHYQRRDILVAVEVEKGRTIEQAVDNLPDIPADDVRYFYKWVKPRVEVQRREARNKLILRLYRLGWSNRRIADHMGLKSTRQIASVIAKNKG